MFRKSPTPSPLKLPRWYRGPDVPMSAIRKFARDVAALFHPDKIILFGSHAYGTPHADSDVDILVIMPARNELDQSVKICLATEYHFPLDLLVRTPAKLAWRLSEGDSFLSEVVDRGKVLYERANGRVDQEGRARLSRRAKTRTKPRRGK